MAEKWCDHGAYGVYAAVPTWGAAQDGDGTAKTVGTPSTAEVVFTGVPSSGVISVLGQTITFTRVTDANTCANNLATAINASTAVATGPASFTTLSQVRNHLYARGPANGAPAGTCQIMTRQASAAHAGLVAVTHTLNNVSSAGTINFVGGTGGCWGFLTNSDATTWPSAVARLGYGVWSAISSYTGSLDPGDVVKVRSAKVIEIQSNSNVGWATKAMGSSAGSVYFVIDDGTEWADGTDPVLIITQATSANHSYTWNTGTARMAVKAKRYADGTSNLRFASVASGGSSLPTVMVGLTGGAEIASADFDCSLGGGAQAVSGQTSQMDGRSGSLYDCRFIYAAERNNGPLLVNLTANAANVLRLRGCQVILLAPSSPQTAPVVAIQSGQRQLVELYGCEFKGFLTGSRFGATSSTDSAIYAHDCNFGGINDFGPYGLLKGSASDSAGIYSRMISGFENGGSNNFFVDSAYGFAEWNASKGVPTLNARQLDGVSPWSIRMKPPVAVVLSPTAPFLSPAFLKVNSLPTGVRTLTLELLIDTSLAFSAADIALLVDYVNADGERRSIRSLGTPGQALATSSAAWSALAWNGQDFNRFKIILATPEPMLTGSIVTARVALHIDVVDTTKTIVVDPELVVV